MKNQGLDASASVCMHHTLGWC